ncbi:hypothetical protein CBL_00204 [Carabus blaptoides fortunei]
MFAQLVCLSIIHLSARQETRSECVMLMIIRPRDDSVRKCARQSPLAVDGRTKSDPRTVTGIGSNSHHNLAQPTPQGTVLAVCDALVRLHVDHKLSLVVITRLSAGQPLIHCGPGIDTITGQTLTSDSGHANSSNRV